MLGFDAIGEVGIGEIPDTTVTITLAVTEGSDILSSTFSTGATISSLLIESADTLVSSLLSSIAISSAVIEASDILAASATINISISSGLSEASDIVSSLVTIVDSVSSNLTELPDQLSGLFLATVSISSNLIETSDLIYYVQEYYTLKRNDNMLSSSDAIEFAHAPDANLDYGFDWVTTGWLAPGEVIISSHWTVDSPLVKTLEQNLNGITSLFISGGVVGHVYKLTNTITTSIDGNSSIGRTDSRTIKLSCKLR